MGINFWLVTTGHLSDRIWFRDEEDFKAAMNIIALLSCMPEVQIISFILMSNHVHFILGCSKDDAGVFITRFKKMYSQYYSKKYGICALLYRNRIDIKPLSVEDESLERGIAYVLMNSVAANICINSTSYPWGTGNTFFRVGTSHATRIGTLSGRARERIMHSKRPVPDDYVLDPGGFIDPVSYVPFKFVESVFRTPRRMNWFLQNSSKARRLREAPAFNDQFIASAVQNLLVSLFRQTDLSRLSKDQCAELFRQIRFRFSSDPGQIARVCKIPYGTVCALLEKV